MTWQPIETAPKNGTSILLGATDLKTITLACWLDAYKKWATISEQDCPDSYQFDFFTHWMPLPEPPK